MLRRMLARLILAESCTPSANHREKDNAGRYAHWKDALLKKNSATRQARGKDDHTAQPSLSPAYKQPARTARYLQGE